MATSVLFESGTDTVITGLAVGDMNGDGSFEVAAASREGNIWVIDPDTGKLLGSLEGTAGAYGIALVETGMGEFDIVVGTRDRHLKWINATSLDTVQSSATTQWVHALRSADFTGDGYLDIVGTTGESLYGDPDGFTFLVDGLSKEVLWRSEQPQGRIWGLDIGDLTGDGIPDIVVGPSYTNRQSDPEVVRFAGTDTDGHPFEIPVTRNRDRSSLQIYDGATRDLVAARELPGHDLNGLLVADLDGDTVVEIAVGDRRGYLRVYTLVDGQLALEWESGDLGIGLVGMAFGDVAGTGRRQIVCGTTDGRLHQIAGERDAYALIWTSQDLGTHLWGIAISDIDNDGAEEVITANGNGTLFVLDGRTHRLKYRRDGLASFLGAYNSIVVEDIDRNGRKEVIVGSSGYLYVFEAST